MAHQEKLIDIHRFFPKEEIGEGVFSVVFKIEDKETKEVFAAKVLNAPLNPSQKENMISFSREVNYNSGMNHPCVLKFYGYSPTNFNGDPNPVIVTEYCKNASLITYIESPELYRDVWNDTKKLITIYGIASGMKYLHENKIIHRDLKPENILMDDYLCPKISDFGLSKKIDHTGKTMSIEISAEVAKGTPIYMAPEVFKTYTSTFESDVYSFGILLYEIVTNTIPYNGLDFINLMMKLYNGSRPPFETPIVDSYRNLIERCWDQEPKNRPTFSEIVDELSQNQEFITDDVNEEDYRSYIRFIEGYQSSFNESKIVKLQDYIQSGSKTFREIDIKRYIEKEENGPFMNIFKKKKEKLYPAEEFIKLNKSCQQLVVEAENDPEKQFYIGTYLIERKCDFPLNIKLGVTYFERSILGGNVDSIIYLSKMLMDGKLIEKDLMKAEKYLKMKYRKDNQIYYFYAKLLKKMGNIKKARKIFKEGAKNGQADCMYKFAKMLFYGEGGKMNNDDAMKYFKLSQKAGYKKSDLFLRSFDFLNQYDNFSKLSDDIKHFFIKKTIDQINSDKKQIEIKYNDTEDFFYEKMFFNHNFINTLQLFDTILIEVLYPLDIYDNYLYQIANINENIFSSNKILIKVFMTNFEGLYKNINITKTSSSNFNPYKNISIIEIQSDVKSIPMCAFAECSLLTRIIIPHSVTSIESYAFSMCHFLEQVELPSSVLSIGNRAFSGCSSLREINIPSFITSIEDSTFLDSGLTQIIIPSSVTLIGNQAFSNCTSLKNINIPSSVTLIGKYAFQNCISLKNINIPSSVTSIGEYAFQNCLSLTQVIFEIPSSLASFGEFSFDNCSSLQQIAIPCSVKLIASCTFSNCSSLKQVTIPSSVTKIEKHAFYNCSSMEQISIPSCLIKIGGVIFAQCSSLTKIIILPGEVTIFDYYDNKFLLSKSSPSDNIFDTLLWAKSSISTAVIPYFIKRIESNAFSYSSLKQITIPSSVKLIEDFTFFKCHYLEQVTIPSSVTKIGFCAFCECESLKSILIPSSVTSIGYGAFKGCSLLEEIIIPSYVTIIEAEAFTDCKSLTKFAFPSSVTVIQREVLGGCSSLKQISIPSSIVLIDANAFKGCSSLEEITIPSSVTNISFNIFSGCYSLKRITIPQGEINSFVFYEDKFLLSKSSPQGDVFDTLCWARSDIEIANIPPFIRKIEGSAFEGCSLLKQIQIPDSVTEIECNAFSYCSLLEQVTLPPSLKEIEDHLFYGCSSLTQIEIRSSIEKIGWHSFTYCSSLREIMIPSSVTGIGKEAFKGCSLLKQITIPPSVNLIYEGAFCDCSSLTKIIVLSPEESIYFFYDDKYLLSRFSESDETYDTLFWAKANIDVAIIPSFITTIKSSAFRECSMLKQVTIPSSITSIEEYTFKGCSSLESITIPSFVTIIKDEAFSGCSSISSVTFPPSVVEIQRDAFKGCSSLKQVTFLNPIAEIKDGTFPSHTKVIINSD